MNQESTLQERVNRYLCGHTARSNAFVAKIVAAETAHADAEMAEMSEKSIMAEDAELNEYLLSRAEQELRAAQDKLNTLKQKIADVK